MLGLWSGLMMLLVGFDQLYQRYRVRQLKRYAVSDIRHLQQLAFYDPMTQLPNREALLVELNIILNRAQRHHLPFSLCFMDCDNFKKINDEAGHHVGDGVLKHIADVVLQNIRKNDFFSRLSGDEFCLILEGTTSDEAIHVVLTKLQHAISQLTEIDGYQVSVSMSIGVAVYSDAEISVDALLMQADKAMYHAKRNQKGTYYITRNLVDGNASSPELA
jgi:diguanylate cyclase (GGDEF)-like protein